MRNRGRNGLPLGGGYVYQGDRPTPERMTPAMIQAVLDAHADNRRQRHEAPTPTLVVDDRAYRECSTPWCHSERRHGTRCWGCRKAMTRGDLIGRVDRLIQMTWPA